MNDTVFRRSLAAAAAFALLTAGGCSLTPTSPEPSETTAASDVPETQPQTKAQDGLASSLAAPVYSFPEAPDTDALLTDLCKDTDFSEDPIGTVTEVQLQGDSITVSGSGASVSGTTLTITAGGSYRISGTLTDGRILVNTEEKVQILLENAHITCTTSAPLFVQNAKHVWLTRVSGTENSLTDASSYTDVNAENEPDAALFSKDGLTIHGEGSLTVTGNFNEGVSCKDELRIVGGTLTVQAVGNGVKGKDSVAVQGGSITITAGADGIKSDNTDAGTGFVILKDAAICITAGEDGIQAESELYALADITITAGDAPAANQYTQYPGNIQLPEGMEMPTMPEGMEMPEMPEDWEMPTMPEGMEMPTMPEDWEMPTMPEDWEMPTMPEDWEMPEFPDRPQGDAFRGGWGEFDWGDDADLTDETGNTISCKGMKAGTALWILDGSCTVTAQEDALHANGSLYLYGGTVTLTAGDDGMDAAEQLVFHGGTGTVVQAFEGVEAAEILFLDGCYEIHAQDDGVNATDGTAQGGMGTYTDGASLHIAGGTFYVEAGGDGLDSNGNIQMTGGLVLVDGPENSGNGAIDANGSISCTGGTLIAVGSAGMAEAPDSAGTVALTLDSMQAAGTAVTFSGDGRTLSYVPQKSFQSVVVYSDQFTLDTAYTITLGGSCTGEGVFGYFEDAYDGSGTAFDTVTPTDRPVSVGTQSGGFGGMGGFGNHGGRRQFN